MLPKTEPGVNYHHDSSPACPLFPRGKIILFLNVFGFLNTYGSLRPKLFPTYVNIPLGCLILGTPSISSSQRSPFRTVVLICALCTPFPETVLSSSEIKLQPSARLGARQSPELSVRTGRRGLGIWLFL